MTIEEVAELLRVKKSWLYQQTRLHGEEGLQHTKVGRYIRFTDADFDAILRKFNPTKEEFRDPEN